MSDNGGSVPHHGNNWPLRGSKVILAASQDSPGQRLGGRHPDPGLRPPARGAGPQGRVGAGACHRLAPNTPTGKSNTS